MLSYRHAFHAGNHADVLKHFVLVQLLRHLARKDKPFHYIDTHAGAGRYALDSGYATKNAESASGIGRLWSRPDLPEALADYVARVRVLNPGDALRVYPGSPLLALPLLREADRMSLFELHGADFALLAEAMAPAGRRAAIYQDDGFATLRALLPPPSRRGLVLIDPPYEDKRDYTRAVQALEDSLRRFPDGLYMLWYPLLKRPESRRLPERLRKLAAPAWLALTLSVRSPAAERFGMHGSGLFIVNPPWSLPPLLEATMPWLTQALRQDDAAGFTLEYAIP